MKALQSTIAKLKEDNEAAKANIEGSDIETSLQVIEYDVWNSPAYRIARKDTGG